MHSENLLNTLHSMTLNGQSLAVADTLKGGAIRLSYRHRPDGIITKWYVEGPGVCPAKGFQTEAEAREFIKCRWNIEPRTKQWGEP